MSAAKKTSYSNEFKFKIALESIKGQKTLVEICKEYNIASCLVSRWKKELLDNGSNIFNTNNNVQNVDNKEQVLYEQLGRQTMEINYLKKFVNRYQ